MRFYSFGHQNNPVLLLLPGTCCHWKSNFGSVIPLLEKDFHVVCYPQQWADFPIQNWDAITWLCRTGKHYINCAR